MLPRQPGARSGENFLVLLSLGLALSSLVKCLQPHLKQCTYDLEEIKNSLNKSGNVNSFTVNCLGQDLVHNGTHAAQSISVSVFSDDGDIRYDFQCVGGTTLIPTLSIAVTNVSNLVCSSCDFTANDPCETSESRE